MHITFMQLIGYWCIGLGCYVLLGLAFPRLRPRDWLQAPASLFVLAALFFLLLGLWGFGIARPYTWIAAMVVWGIGFLIERRRPRESGLARERIMNRGEAIIAFVLFLAFVAVVLRVLLRFIEISTMTHDHAL
jgi:hypothetical protein